MGQAVDFYIPNIHSKEIGKWITKNTVFDRLYFYGDYKPIHVSVGPENKKQIIIMKELTNSAKLIPQIIKNL